MGRPRKHPSTSSESSVSSVSSPSSGPTSEAGSSGSPVSQGVPPFLLDGLEERLGHGRGGHGRQVSWAGSMSSDVSGWSGVSVGSSSGAGGEAGSVGGESMGSEAWVGARMGINFEVAKRGEHAQDADAASLRPGPDSVCTQAPPPSRSTTLTLRTNSLGCASRGRRRPH